MRLAHHHHVRGPGLRHHFGFEVPAVHGLEIGHDRVREFAAQPAHRLQTFGQNQGRACFQPIHARAHRALRHVERFSEVGEVKRDLYDRMRFIHAQRPIKRQPD